MARSGLGRFASPARLSSIDIVGGRDMFVLFSMDVLEWSATKQKQKKRGARECFFSVVSMGRFAQKRLTPFLFFYPVAIACVV